MAIRTLQVGGKMLVHYLQKSVNILFFLVGFYLFDKFGGVEFTVATTKDHWLALLGLALMLIGATVLNNSCTQHKRSLSSAIE